MSVQDYMNLPYNFVTRRIEDESGAYFHISVLELDGCQSTGDTIQEAYDGIVEAMEGWIETKLENGVDVPAPICAEKYDLLLRQARLA
jgi:predicted RNase H-like HicB family nuclease